MGRIFTVVRYRYGTVLVRAWSMVHHGARVDGPARAEQRARVQSSCAFGWSSASNKGRGSVASPPLRTPLRKLCR